MKSWLVMLTIVGLALTTAWAQRDFSDVQIKATHVAGNIHMLQGAGGNIGVSVGDDGILIVDDQFAPLAKKIQAALAHLSSGDLKFILNTHYHGDHTGGNEIFGKEATIIAHANVRKRLSESPPGAWPVITFNEGVTVHFNGEPIEVAHFPTGHTDGDSVMFFKGSNVVHMGDHFFRNRFPYVDMPSGGNALGLHRNIGKVIALVPADVKIIPGHGALSTLEDLKTYQSMMTETIATVREMKAEGKDLAAIQQAGLDPKWESWGSGFISQDRWIEFIYNSLE